MSRVRAGELGYGGGAGAQQQEGQLARIAQWAGHAPFEMQYLRSGFQEVSDVDARLAKDGAERSLGEITGVVRQGDLVTGVLVTPDFVASWPRTVILITERPQTPGDLPVLETRQAAHCRTLTGTSRSILPADTRLDKAGGIGSP